MTTMATDATSTDRIEKHFEVRAPRAKVWRAIADSRQFSTWFGINLSDPFVAGRTTRGNITAKGYEHFNVEFMVERIEAERYFSYRWHPYPSDPKVDYSTEPTTLVEFTLEEVAGGTAVTIVESGFDRIPLARRAEAFRMNDGGWSGQVKNLTKYVA